MNYLSNENKGLLWGILQESDIFNNIPDNKFSNVKQIFETTMRDINIKMGNNNLMEKNKFTIETLMSNINNDKHTYINGLEPESSKLKVVYRAQDIQKKRNIELNSKLEEHRNNMTTMINPKKPTDINFADATDDDDKPIGDDMDRLISERLASRERELEIPTLTTEGEKWLNTTSNTVIKPNKPINLINPINPINHDKHVSFGTTISEDIKTTENTRNTTNPSLANLLNKIKKKSEPEPEQEQEQEQEQVIMELQGYENENENENENMSIKNEIKYLIKMQNNLIAEHIDLKNRLNVILNKI